MEEEGQEERAGWDGEGGYLPRLACYLLLCWPSGFAVRPSVRRSVRASTWQLGPGVDASLWAGVTRAVEGQQIVGPVSIGVSPLRRCQSRVALGCSQFARFGGNNNREL